MALTSADIIARENAAVIAKMAGVPMAPATSSSDEDSRNPNLEPSGAGRSTPGSTSGLGRAPQRTGRHLRLAWSAP